MRARNSVISDGENRGASARIATSDSAKVDAVITIQRTARISGERRRDGGLTCPGE